MNEHLVLIDFGTIELYWNGFLIGCAVLFGSLFYCKLRKIQGYSFSEALATVLWALPAAFLLSRISYCWFRSTSFLGQQDEYFNCFDGGASILGALTGISVVVLIRSRIRKNNLFEMADAASPPLALAIAICRFASGTGNEETGFEINTSLPLPFVAWSETEKANLLWVGFFEGLVSLVITGLTAALFFQLYHRKNTAINKGSAALCFMLAYGLSQALLESMKGDSLFMVTLGFVRIDQIGSILIAVTAIVVICAENCRVCGFSFKKLLLWIVCAAALAAAVLCEFSLNATYLGLLYFCMFVSLLVMWIIAAVLFLRTVKAGSAASGKRTSAVADHDASGTIHGALSPQTLEAKDEACPPGSVSIRKMTRASIEELIDSLGKEEKAE